MNNTSNKFHPALYFGLALYFAIFTVDLVVSFDKLVGQTGKPLSEPLLLTILIRLCAYSLATICLLYAIPKFRSFILSKDMNARIAIIACLVLPCAFVAIIPYYFFEFFAGFLFILLPLFFPLITSVPFFISGYFFYKSYVGYVRKNEISV